MVVCFIIKNSAMLSCEGSPKPGQVSWASTNLAYKKSIDEGMEVMMIPGAVMIQHMVSFSAQRLSLGVVMCNFM